MFIYFIIYLKAWVAPPNMKILARTLLRMHKCMLQYRIIFAQSGRTKSTMGELKASIFTPMSRQFALLKTLG